jgi:hypothetical protein
VAGEVIARKVIGRATEAARRELSENRTRNPDHHPSTRGVRRAHATRARQARWRGGDDPPCTTPIAVAPSAPFLRQRLRSTRVKITESVVLTAYGGVSAGYVVRMLNRGRGSFRQMPSTAAKVSAEYPKSQRTSGAGKLLLATIMLVVGIGLVGSGNGSVVAVSDEVLILDTTVTNGASSAEATAVSALGLTPVVVSASAWSAMSASDFAGYRGIVLGDDTCDYGDAGAAIGNKLVWGPVVDGNVLLVGTDPVFHAGQGGSELTTKGIAFAFAEPGTTGLYATLSCYFHGVVPGTPVPMLDGVGESPFTVTGGWLL